MKKLIPFLVLLASCSTVHKVSHTEKKNTDSTAAVVKDSSYKSTSTTQTDDLDVKDFDVTVYYEDSKPISYDSAAFADAVYDALHQTPMKTGNKKLDSYAELIKQAISGTGRVSAIQIHIGSISDSSTRTHTVDTGSAHTQSNIHVKTADKIVDKKVDKTGPALGVKIGIGLVLLIGLLALVFWAARKLHII